MTYALDASALLAWLEEEPAADLVEAALPGSVLATVSLGEVFLRSPDLDSGDMAARLRALGVRVQPLTVQLARQQARVPNQVEYRRDDGQTKRWRLGWGDRTVAALGLLFELPILTSDRTPAALGSPYRFELFR